MVACYFQRKEEFDNDGGYQWGGAKADYVSWTSLSLTVKGYAWFLSSTEDPVYLVCDTTGSLQNFGGLIRAIPYETSEEMTGDIAGMVEDFGI